MVEDFFIVPPPLVIKNVARLGYNVKEILLSSNQPNDLITCRKNAGHKPTNNSEFEAEQ